MNVLDIPFNEIHADEEFNCRGVIPPIDVVELARDIDTHTLQNPLVVHPYDEERRRETGFNYRLISGYRRHKAVSLLDWKTVPCNVLENVSDTQARIMNLGENINRKELNILQEAKALERLKYAGLGQEEVAKQLGQSRGWVQVRFYLLELPIEVQEGAAQGLFSQQQIRDLYTLGSKERQLIAAKTIKERREKGEKVPDIVKKPISPFLKKERKRNEVFEMMERIQSILGNSLATRCLAWTAGEISTADLETDIREAAHEKGVPYEVSKDSVRDVS